jgi:hypothetical protein
VAVETASALQPVAGDDVALRVGKLPLIALNPRETAASREPQTAGLCAWLKRRWSSAENDVDLVAQHRLGIAVFDPMHAPLIQRRSVTSRLVRYPTSQPAVGPRPLFSCRGSTSEHGNGNGICVQPEAIRFILGSRIEVRVPRAGGW